MPSPAPATTTAVAAVLLAAPLAGRAAAQPAQASAPAAFVVQGTVRDSLAGGVLAGATVQLVPADVPAAPGVVAYSDSAGRFAIGGVASGRYLLGFVHPRPDALGIAVAPRVVTVAASAPAGAPLRADLAVPGARTVAAAACGGALRDSTGVLAGRVVRAADGAAAPGAVVVVRWGEVVVDSRGVRRELRSVRAVAAEDGRYVACGVPADVPMLAQAWLAATSALTPVSGADSTARGAAAQVEEASGAVEVALDPASPFRVRDLLVAAAARMPVASGARLTGRVLRPDGRPLEGARVVVRGPHAADTATTGAGGRYRITALAAGTHPVDVFAIGYAPARAAADLRPGADATLDVTLTRRVARLDPVSVYAAGPSATHEFSRRRRLGAGYFLTPDDIARRGARFVGDALTAVPGMRIVNYTAGRPVVAGRFGCPVHLYLDGFLVSDAPAMFDRRAATVAFGPRPPSGTAELDSYVAVQDIGGVEAYQDFLLAPPQYRPPGADPTCGSVVLVWTKGALQ